MSSTLKWLLVVLVLVILVGGGYYYYQNYYQKTTVPTTPVKKEVKEETKVGVTKEQWKTYAIVPKEEEAAELRQAVKFSIKYLASWNYKVLDEEVKKDGAGNILHFVGFSDKISSEITQTDNRVAVYADSHLFEDRKEIDQNGYGKQGTESTLSTGEKVVKFVGKKQSPAGVAEEETITVIVEPPADWTLVIEGKRTDETTIDQMVQSLKF